MIVFRLGAKNPVNNKLFLGLGSQKSRLIIRSMSSSSQPSVPPTNNIDVSEEDLTGKPESYWRQLLTPAQYRVCRAGGTELPFSHPLSFTKSDDEDVVFACVCCGNKLFSSKDKFYSGTGWPSFTKPHLEKSSIMHVVKSERDEISSGCLKDDQEALLCSSGVEVKCRKCQAHLGHVFRDGPDQATGFLRYCINGICLK